MSETPNLAQVAIVSDTEDKSRCLVQSIEAARLREELDAKRRTSGQDAFPILIKPDMTFFFRPAVTMTDPDLVECLIDWLHDAGYTEVRIGTARDGSASWLENRDPLVMADLAGYHYRTPKGRDYEVVDLSEDLEPAAFPDGSVLKGSSLSREWLHACFRISFGKCKTDEAEFYCASLQNLVAVLPLPDKELHYQHRLRAEDAVSELLLLTPVHFAIVDAYLANQGNAGGRSSNAAHASTIIASANPPLADWATALKIGIDPYSSPVVARALRNGGLPERPKIIGDLAPFPAFRNVHPMIADSVRKRNASLEVQRSATAWLQTVDRHLFPFKDAVTSRLNSLLAYQFSDLDSNPLAYAAFLAWNYSLAGVAQAVEGTRTMLAKDKVHWIERPLNLDLAAYSPADYEKSRSYMEPLEEIVIQQPPDKNGLRWRYLDNSVLFHCSRTLPIPFDAFVERVEIARSVRTMNDYIGGACVPVLRNEAGRVTHQAERNLYLPQPNYIVFTGGQPIDVSKLEFITYSENQHKIFWRTIKSENNTGKFDDGTVSFDRAGDGSTMITIVARQEFILPPFWQLMNLDLNPLLKDYLVSDAYKNFFTRTIANFEAVFEGRDYRAGKPWAEASSDAQPPPLPSERLAEGAKSFASGAREAVDRATSRFSLSTPRPQPVTVDEQGFAHFEPKPAGQTTSPEAAPVIDVAKLQGLGSAAVGFVKDLVQAINRDLTTRNDSPKGNSADAGTGNGR